MAKILFSKSFLIPTLTIAITYMVFVTYLMNYKLLVDAIFGSYSLAYKYSLLFSLLGGMWTAMSGYGLFILTITALLTGINLTLFVSRIFNVRKLEKVGIFAGGGSILGFIGSGCAACGLPLISLLGLSASIIYLPFRGMEIAYLSIGLLSISIYYLTKSNNTDCKINR